MRIPTYIDSGVWIAAIRGEHRLAAAALAVMDDPTREILYSDFVRLETLPKPTFNDRTDEVRALQMLFGAATKVDCSTPKVAEQAIELAGRDDVAPMDALHLATAVVNGAVEFVTTEKRSRPMFRCRELGVSSITQDEAA